MKKTFFAALLLLVSTVLEAQPYLVVNNNGASCISDRGDIYVTAYAVTPPCGTVIDYTVPTLVTLFNPLMLDLSQSGSWNSGTVPTGYDLAYVVVTRDPACGVTGNWGNYHGSAMHCNISTDFYYDEVTIGDPNCGFLSNRGIVADIIGGSCGSLNDGDFFGVMISYPGGTTAAQIDTY